MGKSAKPASPTRRGPAFEPDSLRLAITVVADSGRPPLRQSCPTDRWRGASVHHLTYGGTSGAAGDAHRLQNGGDRGG